MSADGETGGGAGQTRVGLIGPDEWSVYRETRLTALAEAPYAFSSTLEQERAFDEEAWRYRVARGATFLAWRDGRPAGTAAGAIEDPADDHAVAGAWQLVGMWVHPQARGLGVADLLVGAVVDQARAAGAVSLVLWVTDASSRARTFYERMGFRATGLRQAVRPDEPDHMEELMIRDFG